MNEIKRKPCPQCGKPAVWEGNPHHPFCCERCKLIDLGSWAMESYRIPDRMAMDEDVEGVIAESETDDAPYEEKVIH
jgi:endogenous inhibitor of DNA gyrase (YacG/DUF329 family)